MKGKFIYIYADGHRITDRNGYQTISQARSYAAAYNKHQKNRAFHIVQVVEKTTTRRPARRQSVHPLFDFDNTRKRLGF